MTLSKSHRPHVLPSLSWKIRLSEGNHIFTVTFKDSNPYEVFIIGPKHNQTLFEAIGRLTSHHLRQGLPPEFIIDQLGGIKGREPVWLDGEQILSVPDALAKVLKKSKGIIDKNPEMFELNLEEVK